MNIIICLEAFESDFDMLQECSQIWLLFYKPYKVFNMKISGMSEKLTLLVPTLNMSLDDSL